MHQVGSTNMMKIQSIAQLSITMDAGTKMWVKNMV